MTREHAPNTFDSESFQPDTVKISEVLANIQKLKNGEVLKISHAFMIVRIGDKNIAIDPAISGRSLNKKEPNKLIPPSGGLASMSDKGFTEKYDHSMIALDTELNQGTEKKTEIAQIASILAPHLDCILISHLDADHYDFEFIRTVLENNPNASVFGPLGWQAEIAKYHSLEGVAEPVNPTNHLPETISKRLKALSGKPANPENDRGLNFPKLNLDRTKLGSVSIKAIDIPHSGGLPAEYVQGFILESGPERILIISDAALSPEAIKHVEQNLFDTSGQKLTQICVSTATLNPETFYGLLNEEKSDKLRDNIEEGIAHSAYLPVIIAALTSGEVKINLNHSGFYYRSSAEKSVVRNRYPEWKSKRDGEIEPTAQQWLVMLKEQLDKTLSTNQTKINKLGPWSSAIGKKGRISFGKFVRDFATRRKFAKEVIAWIKETGVPDSVLELLTTPQANEVTSPLTVQ